jgi:hypothetical protein
MKRGATWMPRATCAWFPQLLPMQGNVKSTCQVQALFCLEPDASQTGQWRKRSRPWNLKRAYKRTLEAFVRSHPKSNWTSVEGLDNSLHHRRAKKQSYHNGKHLVSWVGVAREAFTLFFTTRL